jgi:signal transduction histidine kinase/DNA-binding response OmpR family regulator
VLSSDVLSTTASRAEILLVDDDPKTLLAMQAVLGEIDAQLTSVDSGREALLRILERDFALILLDVQMPGLDGFETAALIRDRERTRHTPIIFLTAFNQHDSAMLRGYALGAVDFMFKPIVPEVLRSKVTVFVELHRKTKQIQLQRLVEERQRWEADRLRTQAEDLGRAVAERDSTARALVHSNARLALLSDIANRLLLGQRPRELLDELCQRVLSHLALEVYTHYLADEARGVLLLDSSGGIAEELLAAHREIAFGEGLSGTAALTRRRVIAENIADSDDERHRQQKAIGLHAYACFPLLAEDRLMGTLAFGARNRARFSLEDLATMQMIADQIAIALDRERLIAALKERNAELAEADRRKDEFLAMLAHELRNPLAPVVNALHIIGKQAEQDAIRRAHRTMDRQVRHLIRLVDDLLDVSRFTHGKIDLRRETGDLREVIELALQIARPLVAERGHELVLDLPVEELPVLVDVTRMTQVVSNLVNNAAKYTERGGTITLAASRGEDEVVLRVRDTGVGIAADMLPRVFELFVQGERSSDRAAGGLGIGLTLVKRMVQMHGGDVVAFSDGPGRGSEFVVALPLAPAVPVQSAASKVESRRLSTPGRQLRILVIEDNADVRETLRELLEIEGHVVTLAEDGQRGVDLAGNGSTHDVALVDIGLPGLDGYEVAQRLADFRKQKGSPARLIAMSGYGQAGDRRRALEAGFDAHLVKPVDPETLMQVLATDPLTLEQGDA